MIFEFLPLSPAALLCGLSLVAARTPAQDPPAKHAVEADASAVRNAPIADFQVELLDLAWSAVSAMPLVPHAKNRSRAQEGIVAACLQLAQPLRALACLKGITDWRRGTGYADVASWLGRRGAAPSLVATYLDLAESIAAKVAADPEEQTWRAERIRARVATTLLVMGTPAEAERRAAGIQTTESSGFVAAKAALVDAAGLDEQLAELDQLIALRDVDSSKSAFEACAELHSRFYAAAARRAAIEQRLDRSNAPFLVQLPFLAGFVRTAVAAGDVDGGKRRLHAMAQQLENERMVPEDQVRSMALLATLHHAVGDVAAARDMLEAATARFEAARAAIFDFERAEVLCPLAEAWLATGERERALATWARAVEEGSRNVNARPRAEDLALICCSMAVHAAEPSPELRARMNRIRETLDHPW